MDDRPIVLIGFMGSGKSTVGQRLARRLGWDFLDTDQLVEQREGMAIEQIFLERGEESFRRAESEVLAGLDGLRRTVVATGGGAFLRASNRRLLRQIGHTVWLDVLLESCAMRVGQGKGRPLWQPSDPIALRALFDRRAAVYALADRRLRVSGDSADQTVGLLLGIFD